MGAGPCAFGALGLGAFVLGRLGPWAFGPGAVGFLRGEPLGRWPYGPETEALWDPDALWPRGFGAGCSGL